LFFVAGPEVMPDLLFCTMKRGLGMRLDKYLKVSRIIKRRTVANEACDAGKVLVNEKIARASYDVKLGDIIELQLGARVIKVKVLSVNEFAKKEDASLMYEVIAEK
jgi:ribosomal 50S subunit-recycling heat shock protein